MHVGRLDVLFFGVQNFLMEDLLLNVADGDFLARAVVFQQAGLVLAHAPGDLGGAFVDGSIDVLGDGLHFDDDVIGTEEDDFCEVSVMGLNVEHDLGLNDAGIIKVESFDLLVSVLADRIGDFHVSCGDDDGDVYKRQASYAVKQFPHAVPNEFSVHLPRNVQ